MTHVLFGWAPSAWVLFYTAELTARTQLVRDLLGSGGARLFRLPRVVWENSLAAAPVEKLVLQKDVEKSHASDMQLSMSALESSSSNSLAPLSLDLSPDFKASRTRYSNCAWTVKMVHPQSSKCRFSLLETVRWNRCPFDWQ